MTLGNMDHGEGSAAQLIKLEPLIHQVSGHSSLWVLDDVTVCKPLIGREAKFYRSLPSQMRAFTPEFRGTVKVVVQRTAEGVAVAAVPPSSLHRITGTTTCPPLTTKHHNSVQSRRVSSGGVGEGREAKDEHGGSVVWEQKSSSAPPSSRTPTAHNPWLRQCHQRYLSKLKQKVETAPNAVECILLENLTYVYRVPNVLDLKMGTRQYGDDAPESKRKSQTRKAQYTTTPRLGVRLAGMQVFNRDTKCYVCKNKYVGRELTEDGFKQTLLNFLHNGRRFRTDIVEQIICQLTHLRRVVATLDSFRFFTSSLLILYDSYDPNAPSKPINPSTAREDNNHTDQENRNTSREKSDRRYDNSEARAESRILRANSKEALVKDASNISTSGAIGVSECARESLKKVGGESCITKRRDSSRSGNDNNTESKRRDSRKVNENYSESKRRELHRASENGSENKRRDSHKTDNSESKRRESHKTDNCESKRRDSHKTDNCESKRRDSHKANEYNSESKRRDSRHCTEKTSERCSCEGGECSSRTGSRVVEEESISSALLIDKQRKTGSSVVVLQDNAIIRQQQYKQSIDNNTLTSTTSESSFSSTTVSSSFTTTTTSTISNTSSMQSIASTVENCLGDPHDNDQVSNKNLCESGESPPASISSRSNGSTSNILGEATGTSPTINTTSTTNCTTSSNSSTTCRTKVDIRLIDFAHATHKGMGDATIYSGPDEGLMLGLKSLINIFTNIKEIYTK